MGLSSQWNLGRKMHSCPASFIKVYSIDGWSVKSSWWLRWAMQQFWLSIGQTGEHLAHNCWTSKPCSSRAVCRPFGQPSGSVMLWYFPQCLVQGLDMGITVLHCFHCLPPSDLFISKAFSASGRSDAWAEDWSNTKSACFPGCLASNIMIASWTCFSNWSVFHQGSPLTPG